MREGRELVSLKRVFYLLIATLTLSLIASFVYIRKDTRADRERDLAYSASVLREYYHLSFHQWELSLLSVGQRLIELPTEEERLAYATQALSVYEEELLAFGLARPDGQLVLFKGPSTSDSLPNLMKSEQTRRSFEMARNRKSITIGECYYFENVNDWILPIRVPLFDADGDLIALNTSAIDYSRAVAELEQFGFDEAYQIHLINRDFGTTQLLFPLDSSSFGEVLGNDQIQYEGIRVNDFNDEIEIMEAVDPLREIELIGARSEIELVNHQIVITAPRSIILADTLSRFQIILLVYVLLVAGSFILYGFVRRRMKRSLLELQSERANLKSLIESTDDIIGLFDKEFRILEFNRAFEISAKMTDDIDLERGMEIFSKMKSRENAQLFRSYFEKAFTGEKFSVEASYPGPEGDIVFQFTYNPIFQGEEVVGLSFFAKDITEVKKSRDQLEKYSKNLERTVRERTKELEEKNNELVEGYEKLKSTQEQLIRAEKMASLGVLAAGIGHEINNPLNFIKHGAEGLEAELKKQNQVDLTRLEGFFNAIGEGVSRASEMISDIANYSRVGSDAKAPCDIHSILKKSLKIASTRFGEKDIKVKLQLNGEDPKILGNDGKLHQLFTNIIVNAEQAIEKSGTITICTKCASGRIIVTFEDDGKGMSKKTLTRITDPFFTTKQPGEGTGLGLFISQMIINDHQATLDISSEIGMGSTFIISFPQPDINQ